MARFFDSSEIDPSVIQGTLVAVLGYGNQGHAHALNLRDSGVEVIVGLHAESKRRQKALDAGFQVLPVSECADRADLLSFCLPDVPTGEIYQREIAPRLRAGQTLLFADGFNIHHQLVSPPADVDVCLVSPKGPGHGLRSEFLKGSGLAAMVGVDQDATGNAWPMTLSYAWGIGSSKALILETTFKEQTVCDLFGEQTVLCGGVVELAKAGFDTLVAAGYTPEAAYFECIHEIKLIVDLIISKGIAGMREAISDTAEWGGYQIGPRVVGDTSRLEMKRALNAIESGSFARDWVREAQSGSRELLRLRAAEANHPSQSVGERLREGMPSLRDVLRE